MRHGLRYIVNGLSLVAALLAMPEFGAVLPADWVPVTAAIAAVANTLLSVLRKLGMS